MDENHQDNARSKLAAIEDTKWVLNKKNKLWIPKQNSTYKQNSTHKWRNLLARFFKLWATPIGIGTVIAVGTLLWGVFSFNLQQQSAQQSELDQQQETTLQTYIDNIQDLLLNHNLLGDSPPPKNDAARVTIKNVRELARLRTLTTLRRLKADRNRIVLQFLQDAHLIGIRDPVIDLSGADLSGADLSGAKLNSIDLSDADLSDAKLSSADLSGTILNGAKLSGAILSDAFLSDAFLSGTFLNGATLSGADLVGADLRYATLSNAILNGGNLNGAIMKGADLSNVTLNSVILIGADLSGTDLSDADLSNATLSNATLSGAILSDVRNLTQQQLDEVYSCRNAILSTGLICHPNQ